MVAVLTGALTLALAPGPAHAASHSFPDPNEPGKVNVGDMSRVTYTAGRDWNRFIVKFQSDDWGPEFTDIRIDTRKFHPGPEFVVFNDIEYPRRLYVYRTAWKKPWRSIQREPVCQNGLGDWGSTAVTGKIGTRCLKSPKGKLPTRVRINVRTENWDGSLVDNAPGWHRFSRWIRVG